MTPTNRQRSVSSEAQARRGSLSPTWKLLGKAKAQERNGQHAAAARTRARFYALTNTPAPQPRPKSALGHDMGGAR